MYSTYFFSTINLKQLNLLEQINHFLNFNLVMKVRNIFLIDDNSSTLFLHKYFINKTGIEATLIEFNDARKALEVLQNSSKDQLDIVLLDINMPTMTGWEFLEKIRIWTPSQRASLKICVLSSSCNPEDKIKAKNDPIVDFYSEKPYDHIDMLNVLRNTFTSANRKVEEVEL